MGSRLRGRVLAIGVADKPLRDALCRTLEREGASVNTNPNGRSLLAALAAGPADCCILDVDLPDLGVGTLVSEMRKIRPAMPVILLSAHLFQADAAELGDLPVLPLPFRRPQLLDLLQRVLGASASWS